MPLPDGAVALPTPEQGGVAEQQFAGAGVPDSVGTFSQYSKQPALSGTGVTTFNNALTKGLPGIGLGLLDTLGQSLGVLHDNTIPDMLTGDGKDNSAFSDYYIANRPQLRAGGEIAGMFLPGMAALKVLKTIKYAREAGQLGEMLKGSTALDVLLGNSANLTAAEANMARIAQSGAASQVVWTGKDLAAIPELVKARRAYTAARALDGARASIAFELGNRAAFNSSDTFYPADYTVSDQIKWGVIGTAGFAALEAVQARYAVRNLVQAALKSAPTMENLSPIAGNMTNVIFRTNERGIGVTSYAALQQELKNTTAIANNPVLNTNIEQAQVNIKSVLANQLGLMAYDTHPFLPRTKLADASVQLGLTALDKNPAALLFAKKLAAVPEVPVSEFYTGINEKLAQARRNYDVAVYAANNEPDVEKQIKLFADAKAQLQPIEEAANEVHYVIENDGRHTLFKNRAPNWLDTNDFSDMKVVRYNTGALDANGQKVNLKNTSLQFKGDNNIVLHDNFRLEIPKSATPNDYSATYAAASRLIQNWKPVEGQQFILTKQLPWRQVEMTLALGDAQPAAAKAINLGTDFASTDDAKFWVLSQKYNEFRSIIPNTERKPVTGIRAFVKSSKANYTPEQVIQTLNLPEPINAQPQPLIETFAHAQLQGMTSLEEMFPRVDNGLMPSSHSQLDLLNAHLRETAGLAADAKVNIPTSGVLLKQTDTKPLFVAATAAPQLSHSTEMIGALVQAQRDVQLERLANIKPNTSPLVSSVIQKVLTTGPEGGDFTGAANQARAVQTLQDGMVSGQGQLVYQDRINDQFPTMKAAQLIAQNVDKFVDNYVSQLAANSLTPKLTAILAPKNRADLIDFNRIEQSYRHGWDIAGVEPADGGGVKFRLAEDSQINKQLLDHHFGSTDIPEGAEKYMPDMSVTALKNGYTTFIASRQAGELATAISEMSRQSGRENNALRVALGKSAIQIRAFHLPTPELSRNGTWFIRNEVGDVVATYSGDLEQANKTRALEAAQKLTDTTSEVHTAVPLEMVQRDHAIFDDNFFDVTNYADQLAKTGAAIKGGLARTEIDTGDKTLRAMVKSLQQQYLNIGIRSRAAIFEPELNYARQAANMASRNNLGGFNIFDRYIATMFSRAPSGPKGKINALYGTIESGLDGALSWLNAHHTELAGTQEATLGAKAMRAVLRKQSSEEEFAQYKKVLPNWSPLQDTASWAESTFREKMPWTTRPIMAKLSQVTSTMALRFLDAGMAINNLTGVATNMPSVVYALRKLPNETAEQWIARTAAWSTQYTDNIATFSPMKAMRTAIKSYWSGELNGPMADAAKHGYFEPEYASLAKVLTQPINSPNAKRADDFITAASYMADHSEIFSRKFSWAIGYKIGKDLHGFQNEQDAYIFANNFVNEMIGNYAPNNKPAMFQGAVGLPLGAFQTYMFNFGRRMFNYVERGDKAALMAQYIAQASLYGAKSVPGYNIWNSYMTADSSSADDFQSRMDKTLHPGVSELLLNGTLSNIPKIFTGLQGNGIALYKRGSLDFTSIPPSILDMQKAPPMQFLTAVAKGSQATIQNIFSHESFSIQQQEEILARFSTNRALKSIMEMAANVKTNQRGQVIDSGTQDAMHVAAALLGSQTSYSARAQEAYNKERAVQLSQEDAQTTLNDKTRTLVRGGNFDVNDLRGVVKDYVKAGGNPAYLGQWLRNTFVTAMTPVANAKMQELARSGKLLEFENMLAALQQNQNPTANK